MKMAIIIRSLVLMSIANLLAPSATASPRILALLKAKGFRPDQTAIYASHAAAGQVLFQYNEALPLNPASTLKIITSYCSLKTLGPNYRFVTRFYAVPTMNDGISANLFVEGEGDPSLVSEDLWGGVQQMKMKGLKEIHGNIYINDRYLDDSDYEGRQEENDRAYNSKLSATSLNYNTIAFYFTPGESPGLSATISSFPALPWIKVRNQTKTGGRLPSLSVVAGSDSEFTLTGQIPVHHETVVIYRSVSKPSLFFGETLKNMLIESGIRVDGAVVVSGKTPRGTPLLEYESKPFAWILKGLNKFSNNFMGEQLVRHLGARAYGPPGTTQNGLKVLSSCLSDLGIKEGAHFENGSGLSYRNRVTAKTLVRVLETAYQDFRLQPDFISSLAIYGVDGTMHSRKWEPAFTGIMRAKTGSLGGVSSLAGYIPDAHGEIISFAILMNETRSGLWEAQRIQDAIVKELITERGAE